MNLLNSDTLEKLTHLVGTPCYNERLHLYPFGVGFRVIKTSSKRSEVTCTRCLNYFKQVRRNARNKERIAMGLPKLRTRITKVHHISTNCIPAEDRTKAIEDGFLTEKEIDVTCKGCLLSLEHQKKRKLGRELQVREWKIREVVNEAIEQFTYQEKIPAKKKRGTLLKPWMESSKEEK